MASKIPTSSDSPKTKREAFFVARVGSATVRVYRRKRADGKHGFEVSDYSRGARRLRSFPTPESAIAEANRIARLLASGDATAAMMRGPEAASYGRAVELLRPTGDSLELSASRYAEAAAILGSGERLVEAARFLAKRDPSRLPQKTVREAADEFIAQRTQRGASPRYLADLKHRLGRFAQAFAVQVAAVQSADVQAWLDGLRLSPQSARNFQTVLGTFFRFAETRGYIPRKSNPLDETERVRARNGDAVEIYTPSELARMLASVDPAALPALALAAFAGVRTAELLRLDWQAVDIAAGFVTVSADKSKTKSRRLIPIAPNLAQWLAPYAKTEGRVWPQSSFPLHKAWRAAAAAAGTEWRDNGLRHSFASYRLAQTQSAAQVSLEMGNSPAVVFKHYRELVKPAQSAEWFALVPKVPANVLSLNQAAA